jgi:hypothetical protein
LNISLRSRRRRTVVGGAVLALVLGGLAAALPAQASAGPSATSAPTGGKSAAGLWNPDAFTVEDSLNPDGVTTPDAIVTCATSQISNGQPVIAIPLGCLKLYNGEYVEITGLMVTQNVKLTMQTDGNLVLTHYQSVPISPGSTGPGVEWVTMWSSNTTFAGNSNGPGCLAQFQSNDNLVVSNCDGASIWDSATPADANAVLCFDPSLGILTIYDTSTDKILWGTSTIDP